MSAQALVTTIQRAIDTGDVDTFDDAMQTLDREYERGEPDGLDEIREAARELHTLYRDYVDAGGLHDVLHRGEPVLSVRGMVDAIMDDVDDARALIDDVEDEE